MAMLIERYIGGGEEIPEPMELYHKILNKNKNR